MVFFQHLALYQGTFRGGKGAGRSWRNAELVYHLGKDFDVERRIWDSCVGRRLGNKDASPSVRHSPFVCSDPCVRS